MTFPAVLDILISPTGYSDLHEWQKRSCVCVSCVCVICGWKSAYCGVCKVVLVHDEPDQYFYISHQHLTGILCPAPYFSCLKGSRERARQSQREATL